MTQENHYKGIKHVVYLSSNIGTGCPLCAGKILIGHDRMEESMNHFIREHGYKLLHVGAETCHDSDGKPWHSTVAVLGK